MRKTKIFYLGLIIALFVFLRIPYFQNVATQTTIQFLGSGKANFIKVYPRILFLGMIEGVLIALYIQSVIQSVKNSEPTKFDLDK